MDDTAAEKVLILTPVKDGVRYFESYFAALARLTYPRAAISLGWLVGDSVDGSYEALAERLPVLRHEYRGAALWRKDFGFRIPERLHRSDPRIQLVRRAILAKSRNHLLFRALDDEDWVLWLDVDVIEYPPDVIQRLLAVGGSVVHPHCVREYGGPTFDLNAWRDHGRLHLEDLRDEGEVVALDAVGGTMLLVHADLHRDGLVFPPFPYGASNPAVRPGKDGEIETEGLGLLAKDMGVQPLGLPRLEIIHIDL